MLELEIMDLCIVQYLACQLKSLLLYGTRLSVQNWGSFIRVDYGVVVTVTMVAEKDLTGVGVMVFLYCVGIRVNDDGQIVEFRDGLEFNFVTPCARFSFEFDVSGNIKCTILLEELFV